MSERILNGDFSEGIYPTFLYHWDNGVGGGLPYLWFAAKIKGSSDDDSISELTYKIRQQFEINDEALTAEISAWGQWQASLGPVDGYNKFIIELKKPDMSMVELLNVTKTGLIGSGQLLDEVDIQSNFDQYGNYELWLTLKTKSKRGSASTYIFENYNTWVNDGFTLYESDTKVWVSNMEEEEEVATIEKSFSVGSPVTSATVTVTAKGREQLSCVAFARVYLVRPGLSTVTLYNDRLSGNIWTDILDNVDISSYMSVAGIYKLKLEGSVAGFGGYNIAEIHFDDVDLTANWYAYVQSYGWYDNISLDMTLKKYKSVAEQIGSGEDYDRISAVSKLESFDMAETKSVVAKIKRFLEGVKLAESYEITAAFNKDILEFFNLVESYTQKLSLKRSQSEIVTIAEFYEITTELAKEVKELVKVAELYSTKASLFRDSLEVLELAESRILLVRKTLQEEVRIAEDYTIQGYNFRQQLEKFKIAESYRAIKGKLREILESFGLAESFSAKRTHGNLETIYTIGTPTEWDEISPITTQWIKTQTKIMGG